MSRPASKYGALYAKYSFLSDLPMFECDDGWFDLLKDLCEKLDALQLGPKFRVSQIKEKFGRLRVYVDGAPKEKRRELEKIISQAESRSATICEHCGKPGKTTRLNQGCYIITLCTECEAQYDKHSQ